MAYYAIDIKTSLFALIEAESADKAIAIAEEYPWLEGKIEGLEVIDSFNTREDVDKTVHCSEFDFEITSDE